MTTQPVGSEVEIVAVSDRGKRQLIGLRGKVIQQADPHHIKVLIGEEQDGIRTVLRYDEVRTL